MRNKLASGATGDNPVLPVMVPLLLVGAFAGLVGIYLARGLPRLLLTQRGVRWTGALGTKRITWTDMAPVTMRRVRVGITTQTHAWLRSLPQAERRVSIRLSPTYDRPLLEIAYLVEARRLAGGATIGAPAASPAGARSTASSPKLARPARTPWVAVGLVTVLVAEFAAELMAGVSPMAGLGPSTPTLISLGAINRDWMLRSGEWWRVLTAPLLHGGFAHLIANGFVLLVIGVRGELHLGRGGFAVVFGLGALAGSAGTLLLDPGSTTSVGASGAIMALLTCCFVSSFALPPGDPERWGLQGLTAWLLLPALLPVNAAEGAVRVDYGAHLGGAAGGALLGLALWLVRRQVAWNGARLQRAECAIAGVLAAAAVAGVVCVGSHYGRYQALAAALMPQARVPLPGADLAAATPGLLRDYPHDPRTHFFAGMLAARQGEPLLAEAELRDALALAEASPMVQPAMAWAIRSSLVEFLVAEGDQPDAMAAARPLCKDLAARDAMPQIVAKVVNAGLCQ